jgi:hypothetical protein
MNNHNNEQDDRPDLPTKLEFENTLDVAGVWFAAAALLAVLAAGIIVYRDADSSVRVASSDGVRVSVLVR